MTPQEQLQAIANKYNVNPQNPIAPTQSGTGLDSLRQKLANPKQKQEIIAKDTLDKTSGIIASEKRFGQSIGDALSTKLATKTTQQAMQTHSNDIQKLSQESKRLKTLGQDTTRVDNLIRTMINEDPSKYGGDIATIIPSINKTTKQIVGEGAGVLADVLSGSGALSPTLAGAALMGTGAAQENKGTGEIISQTLLGGLVGKIGEVGFNKASPLISKYLTQYGTPLYEKLAPYIPEEKLATLKSFADKATQKLSIGTGTGGTDAINVVNTTVQKPFDIASATASKVVDKIQTGTRSTIDGLIEKDVNNLLNSTKGISNKVKNYSSLGTDIKKELTDPSIFKGIKVDNKKINPDEALSVVNDRLDRLTEAKSKILPELDNKVPGISKQTIRENAINDIRGKYTLADEQDIINGIDKQLAAYPDTMKISEVDALRAKFRTSARNAKGLQKSSSEYSALENGTRKTVFDVTDNLPFDTSGEYKQLNSNIKNLINTADFLDNTLRNQVVKGGRLGEYVARGLGAVAGSQFGVFQTILGAETGGFISNVLTNNQLGSSLKMKIIKEITDDPIVIQKAEELLKNVKNINVPRLPAPRDSFRTVKGSGNTINLPEKTQTTQLQEDIYFKPSISRQNTANNITNNSGSVIPTVSNTTKKKSSDEMVTLYHASPKIPTNGEWRKGTYFAENPNSASSYAQSHHTGDIKIQKVQIPKNLLFKEPTTGNYLLKSEIPIGGTKIGKPLTNLDLARKENPELAKSLNNQRVKIVDDLASEAKKYKSAEEFVSALKGSKTQYGEYSPSVRANIPAGYKNITEMGISPDEMVTIYRGIDNVKGKISKKINDGDFVTTDFDSALSYTGSPKNVVEMEVPAKTLYNSEPRDFVDEPFYTGAEYIYTTKGTKSLPTDSQLTDIWNKANKK